MSAGIKVYVVIEEDKIITGAIFCHVVRIIINGQLSPIITEGNQKWAGAAPILIIILIKNNIKITFICEGENWMVEDNTNIEEINTPEPTAWAKKYLILLSVSWNSEEVEIKGTKDKRFSSSAAQVSNHLDVVTSIKVLKINLEENSNI